jgi:RNA polymerase sigma-70 factor (ECF subfamily)
MSGIQSIELSSSRPDSGSPPARTTVALSRTIGRARAGDRAAQSEVVAHIQDGVYRFCLSQLAHPETAMDATQETVLRLLRGLERFRGEAQLQTWAIGIALNVCRESRRKQVRPPADYGKLSPTETTDPHQTVERREDARRMRRAMIHLSDRQREVVALRFFENLDVRQTAELMGVAPGTVKATTFQALRALKKLLETQP